MSTLVGRYASPDPHAFGCGSSESTGEYFAASWRAADSAPQAQAGKARTTMTTSEVPIKRRELEALTCTPYFGLLQASALEFARVGVYRPGNARADWTSSVSVGASPAEGRQLPHSSRLNMVSDSA